jgi:hypothetical protein
MMAEDKQEKPESSPTFAFNVGVLLLELDRALRTVERCRLALRRLGYSQKQWQEIVKDVDPELRFMLRPKILDYIITYLQSTGHPVNRKKLAKALDAQGAGTVMKIKQTITNNLRNGNLKLFALNKIGLPTWTIKGKKRR